MEKGGGIFRPSLTKQTNYLVLGSEFSGSTGKPSSKLKKAFEYQAMGCPLHIITEEEFISMIDAPLYDLCFGGNKK